MQSLTPPDAVVADFGKTIKAPLSKETNIGPLYTLAPEVNGSSYDGKIDIWSFGLACFDTIFPSVRAPWGVSTRIQSLEQHRALLDKVTEYGSRGQDHALLAQLLEQLLAWDASRRPSATEALAYPFFALCPVQHEPLQPPHSGSGHVDNKPSKITKTSHREQEASPPASPTWQGAENAATKKHQDSSFARTPQLSPTQENTPL